MYNFTDLNNKLTITYNTVDNDKNMYDVFTNEELTVGPHGYVSLSDKIVMEPDISGVVPFIITADININLPTDTKLRYTILVDYIDDIWEFCLVNLTDETIVLEKDSMIADLKTFLATSNVESYETTINGLEETIDTLTSQCNSLQREIDNYEEQYGNIGVNTFTSDGIKIYDTNDPTKPVRTEYSDDHGKIIIDL